MTLEREIDIIDYPLLSPPVTVSDRRFVCLAAQRGMNQHPAERLLAATPIRAVSAAILHQGRFLLVRRGRPPALGLYAFPGGRVEAGETLVDAVHRETSEETGARVRNVRHIVDLSLSSESDAAVVEFVLSVHAAEYAGGAIIAGDDADYAEWFSLDEMAALPLAGKVLDVAKQIVMGTTGQPSCE